MFIGYQNDKIAFIADTREELENMPCVTLDKIEETDKEYFLHNGKYVCEISVEELQAEVRAVRNSYLETYVDPKQLVMVWNSLTAEEQELYKDYRQYLLDYPQTEEWYEQNPLTFDEWKNSIKPVKENISVEEVVVSNLENTTKEID